jgi:DNA-3-methyladenine glycosylase II
MNQSFTENNFKSICDDLAKLDNELRQIVLIHGYPPLFKRTATFETLIHIILEQQVSLASAKAALVKLKEKLVTITAETIITLSDEEMKACYFSRQKISYARHLAAAIISKQLVIEDLHLHTDDVIREQLIAIKGIGNWTVDVFLMMALNRTDCFPTGDIALMNSIKHVKQLPKHTSKEEVLQIAHKWKPNRTIAAYLLWWDYIKRKNLKW